MWETIDQRRFPIIKLERKRNTEEKNLKDLLIRKEFDLSIKELENCKSSENGNIITEQIKHFEKGTGGGLIDLFNIIISRN